MTYEATMIINGHQPVHIGNYPNKEKATEAIIEHATNSSAEKRLPRRFVNRAKHAPKISDSLKQLDVGELLKKEINQGNISFEVVSEATGIPAKRVERIYRNDLPKEDEMRRILEWVGCRICETSGG